MNFAPGAIRTAHSFIANVERVGSNRCWTITHCVQPFWTLSSILRMNTVLLGTRDSRKVHLMLAVIGVTRCHSVQCLECIFYHRRYGLIKWRWNGRKRQSLIDRQIDRWSERQIWTEISTLTDISTDENDRQVYIYIYIA